MLAALNEASAKPAAPPMSHDQQIKKLRDVAPRFLHENPFKVGDIVTPVADGDEKNAGVPHMVISVQPGGFDPRVGQTGSNLFGIIPDMRVIMLDVNSKCVTSYWTTSENYMHYAAPEVSPAPSE